MLPHFPSAATPPPVTRVRVSQRQRAKKRTIKELARSTDSWLRTTIPAHVERLVRAHSAHLLYCSTARCRLVFLTPQSETLYCQFITPLKKQSPPYPEIVIAHARLKVDFAASRIVISLQIYTMLASVCAHAGKWLRGWGVGWHISSCSNDFSKSLSASSYLRAGRRQRS